MLKSFRDNEGWIGYVLWYWDNIAEMRDPWMGQSKLFQILKQVSGCSDQGASLVVEAVFSPDPNDNVSAGVYHPRPYGMSPQQGQMGPQYPYPMQGPPMSSQMGMPNQYMYPQQPWNPQMQQYQPPPAAQPVQEKKHYSEEELQVRMAAAAKEATQAVLVEVEAKREKEAQEAREEQRDQMMQQLMLTVQQIQAGPPPGQLQAQDAGAAAFQAQLDAMARQQAESEARHEREKLEQQQVHEREKAEMVLEQERQKAEQDRKTLMDTMQRTNAENQARTDNLTKDINALVGELDEMRRNPPAAGTNMGGYEKVVADLQAQMVDMQNKNAASLREFQHTMEMERTNREHAITLQANERTQADLMAKMATAGAAGDSEQLKVLRLQMEQMNKTLELGLNKLESGAKMLMTMNTPMGQRPPAVAYMPAPAPQPVPQYQYQQYAPAPAPAYTPPAYSPPAYTQYPVQQAAQVMQQAPAPQPAPQPQGNSLAHSMRLRRAQQAAMQQQAPVPLAGPSPQEVAALQTPPSQMQVPAQAVPQAPQPVQGPVPGQPFEPPLAAPPQA